MQCDRNVSASATLQSTIWQCCRILLVVGTCHYHFTKKSFFQALPFLKGVSVCQVPLRWIVPTPKKWKGKERIII